MIIIEMKKNDKEILDEIKELSPESVTIVESRKFTGQEEVLQALVQISLVAIPALGAIITESIKSKRYISIKHNGLEIKGLSHENAIKVLEELKKGEG